MYLLNIGLITNDHEQVSLPWLRAALTLARVHVRRSAVLQSSTELKFAAELGAPLSDEMLEQLAHDLKQDCIAYYDGDTGCGLLRGPKPWGTFDADQFILVSGGYLGDALRISQMTDEQFEEIMPRPASDRDLRDGPPDGWTDGGRYVGLDRPAWDSSPEARRIYGTRDSGTRDSGPLEVGDEW